MAVLVPRNLEDTKSNNRLEAQPTHETLQKDDLTLSGNWRGISLSSTPGNILALPILHRICSSHSKYLREVQHGLRSGRPYTNLIFSLRVLTDGSQEWQSKLYIVFIDFEKSFDSLHHEPLWKLLTFYGIPEKLVILIIALYEDSQCCIKMTEGKARYFHVLSGVQQG